MQAADVDCKVLTACSGVFSAIQRADGIYYAECLSLRIVTKPGAYVWQLAAGPTAKTLPFTPLVNG
jgi:hypothetical protein